MIKVGLLSDTHRYWGEKYLQYLELCDEMWYAGDTGTLGAAQKLVAFQSSCTVYGNIGGQDLCKLYSQALRLTADGVRVLMKYIGGYPDRYDPSVQGGIMMCPPKLFISGHSRTLRVKFDRVLSTLHINPGAVGIYGLHKVRTMVRFTIGGGTFRSLEVMGLTSQGSVVSNPTFLPLKFCNSLVLVEPCTLNSNESCGASSSFLFYSASGVNPIKS